MEFTSSVSPRTEAALKQQAAANGKDLGRYASELLEMAAAEPNGKQRRPEDLDLQQWSARSEALMAKMREYAKRLPPGHVADDSRETIYAGRGE